MFATVLALTCLSAEVELQIKLVQMPEHLQCGQAAHIMQCEKFVTNVTSTVLYNIYALLTP